MSFHLTDSVAKSKINTVTLAQAISDEIYQPIPRIQNVAHVRGYENYKKLHKKSLENSDEFWGRMAKKQLDWFQPFDQVQSGGFEDGTISWFLNGKINACYNCLDRHVKDKPDAIAILWEGNEPGNVQRITYKQALKEVCKIANALKTSGIKKGDRVALYMPMVPAAAFTMLACARIGAPHIVVFAGFSASSLRDRIIDSGSTVLVTADEGLRGPKVVSLKKIADEALAECPFVKTCFVYKRTGGEISWTKGRDIWLHEAMDRERSHCPCEVLDSEDFLFFLHTSGSTGKPKGLAHSVGGYLTYVSTTHKYVFDYRPGDVFACVADIGWVTGHSYIVYGPLANGATTFMFESTPTYPNPSRYWDMVERHNITQFYTAPTALRALMKSGDDPVLKHNLSSLRVLGSVGEPINPEAWKWYFNIVGKSRCAIVDTYWQTETGGIMVTPLPGATPMKPGAAGHPSFGIELAILDDKGNEMKGNGITGALVVKRPWPGFARTIFGNHSRYVNTYLKPYPGYYFTGDRCIRDKDGFYWITGRLDDVMNVSGHRIGSAEVEGALVEHKSVAEAAVVGMPHDIKGQSLAAYVICKSGVIESPQLIKEINLMVRKQIGGFAVPEMTVITNSLPKTRSGKIMRRLLRKIAVQDRSNLGNITTLNDPAVVEMLFEKVALIKKKKSRL